MNKMGGRVEDVGVLFDCDSGVVTVFTGAWGWRAGEATGRRRGDGWVLGVRSQSGGGIRGCCVICAVKMEERGGEM